MKTKIFQRRLLFIFLLALAWLWIPKLALAAWPGDPTVSVPICTELCSQPGKGIVSDGSGGAIIAWLDFRNGSDIYAQRVDANGNVLWTTNGVPICTDPSVQNWPMYDRPAIVSDGSGGAIITWIDNRGNTNIYAQRVDANGNVLWTENGVLICTDQSIVYFCIASDGSGGAIIAWNDARSGFSKIYAQRVDANGVVQWTENGVPVCEDPSIQGYEVNMVSDGFGGAIIAWYDSRGGIWAQRVNASGEGLWQWQQMIPELIIYDSVPIGAGSYIYMVSDGSGGAIISWVGPPSVSIYAQHVDAYGIVNWTINGVPICIGSVPNYIRSMASDGSGGAIITWQDNRNVLISGDVLINGTDVYAQRVDANGVVQWTENGMAICTVSDWYPLSTVASDGSGGAIIAWKDGRGWGDDIYAQRVDASGVAQWAENGVPVCAIPNHWADYPCIVSDGSGGAIIAWSAGYAIYAHRIFSDGSLPVTLSSFTATVSGGKVTLLWRTETEVNNIGFAIYRSEREDGSYTRIGWIDGAGNSAMPHNYQLIDKTAQEGHTYFYYIEWVDIEGLREKSKIIKITLPEKQPVVIPFQTALFQNFPNPFNPETWIPFQLARDSVMTIHIYDTKGQLMRTFDFGQKAAGAYVSKEKAAYWDGKNESDEKVSSGIYFYEMRAGDFRATKKMVIVK